MIPLIIVCLGILTAAAGTVAMLCALWTLVLGWVERLTKRTFYAYGAWGVLRELKAFKAKAWATGTVVSCGDDDDGQPRVLIHSTRQELMRGPSIVGKRVRIVEDES